MLSWYHETIRLYRQENSFVSLVKTLCVLTIVIR